MGPIVMSTLDVDGLRAGTVSTGLGMRKSPRPATRLHFNMECCWFNLYMFHIDIYIYAYTCRQNIYNYSVYIYIYIHTRSWTHSKQSTVTFQGTVHRPQNFPRRSPGEADTLWVVAITLGMVTEIFHFAVTPVNYSVGTK